MFNTAMFSERRWRMVIMIFSLFALVHCVDGQSTQQADDEYLTVQAS